MCKSKKKPRVYKWRRSVAFAAATKQGWGGGSEERRSPAEGNVVWLFLRQVRTHREPMAHALSPLPGSFRIRRGKRKTQPNKNRRRHRSAQRRHRSLS